MIKILLVEDEEIIREGLKNEIDWNSVGYEIAGTAKDGLQAMEVIEDIKPDLIITDVRMPFMDGLELIEKVKEIYPETFFIVISGHEEFEYAKKAIELGVTEYVLKPVALNHLVGTLEKIRTNISNRIRNKSETLYLKKKSLVNERLLKEQLFRSIIFKQISIENIHKKIQEENITELGKYCVVLIMQIDDYLFLTQEMDSEQIKTLNQSVSNTVEAILNKDENIIFFKVSKHEYIICIVEYEKRVLEQKTRKAIEEINTKLTDQNGASATIAIGGCYDSLEKLSESYTDAFATLDYKFVIGKGDCIRFDDDRIKEFVETDGEDYRFILDIVKEVKRFDKDETNKKIHLLIKKFNLEGGKFTLRLQITISNIYTEIVKMLKENGGSIEEVFSNPIKVYKNILLQETSKEVERKLCDMLEEIINYLQIKKQNKFSDIIKNAKEYIVENYDNKDLSLADIANHVSVATCYFSAVFSQELGQTYKDFLTDLRIGKAKEFMETSKFMDYEICYKVGYNNPTYFSTIFKRKTGKSPTEFRKLIDSHKADE